MQNSSVQRASSIIVAVPLLVAIPQDNDTQKLPIVAKAVILNSRGVYKQEML